MRKAGEKYNKYAKSYTLWVSHQFCPWLCKIVDFFRWTIKALSSTHKRPLTANWLTLFECTVNENCFNTPTVFSPKGMNREACSGNYPDYFSLRIFNGRINIERQEKLARDSPLSGKKVLKNWKFVIKKFAWALASLPINLNWKRGLKKPKFLLMPT